MCLLQLNLKSFDRVRINSSSVCKQKGDKLARSYWISVVGSGELCSCIRLPPLPLRNYTTYKNCITFYNGAAIPLTFTRTSTNSHTTFKLYTT